MKITQLKRVDVSVRGTAAQDNLLESTPKQRRYLLAGIGGLSVLATLAWLAHAWAHSAHTISAERLRIVRVDQGRFVRDVAAQGTVVAAVNPTLFAVAPGTITYAAHAGDAVNRGEVLATLDSPELSNEYQRERATLDSLNAAGHGAHQLGGADRVQQFGTVAR